MGEESVKEPKPSTDDSLLASRIGALLDFYSDRAVAHASFFVASIFGLVTMSAIVLQLEDKLFAWISIPLFFAFSYLGYFTLVRFGFYADISERLTVGLKRDETLGETLVFEEEEKTLREYMNKQTRSQETLLFPKKVIKKFGRLGKIRKIILGVPYWGATVYLGSVVYSKFLKSAGDWGRWFLFITMLIVLFVVTIPWFLYLRCKD